MTKGKKYDLEDWLVNFAAKIILYCSDLPKNVPGGYYSYQLIRSGGSATLNFGEAQGTNTRKDYAHEVGLSLKELKESRVNLKILRKEGYGNQLIVQQILCETEELI